MVTEAKKAKAHKLLKNNEPVLNPMDYRGSLVAALNYYNVNHDNREKKKWFQAHFGKDIKFSLDIPDHNFRIAGALCRMIDNGNMLEPDDLTRLETEYDKIKEASANRSMPEEEVDAAPAKKVIGIQEKMEQKAIEFLGEFSGLVDEFVTTKVAPSVDKLLNSMSIKGPVAKKVQLRLIPFERQAEEIRLAISGKDKEIAAAYSHITKPNLKKLLSLYESLFAGLSQAKVVVERKARVVKEKPAIQVVKHLKYNVEDKDFKLKSVPPAQIVGASEVWFFNPKYRKLMVYEATVGQTLTVRGSTLLNFDLEKSVMKTVRKPELITSLVGQGKRAYAKFFKDIKATVNKGTGRINKDCLILAVFK